MKYSLKQYHLLRGAVRVGGCVSNVNVLLIQPYGCQNVINVI